jgi:hypothetical protein
MEWINIETIIIEPSTKRSLNQISRKESELDLNNIPPITIDTDGKILDGVKRYLVLMKLNYSKVPVVRENKGKKIFITFNNLASNIHPLAA